MKYLIGALLAFIAVFYGCQKEDQSLGSDLLPGIKLIEARNFKDSTSITAYTYTDDSIRVEKPRYSLLGSFNDPVFGYTNAAFSAQFRLPYYPKYEKDAVLDSLILQMSYKYVYGDTITSQTVQVRELNESLNYDAIYYSTYKIRDHAYPEILGNNNFVPKFRHTSTDTTEQIIRVKLNSSLGNRLLKMDSLNMVSNSVFINYFKGLLIETAPLSRKGALLKIDGTSSVLVLHYHTAAHDTLGFAYRLSGNSANVSGYIHDYSSTAFYSNLNKQTGEDSLVYLQPTGGTKVLVTIPNLSKWKDSTNYIINRASLSVRIDPVLSDMKRYEIPPQIYLKYIGTTSKDTLHEKEIFPADADLSATYYGGFYNSTTESYDFNITQHFQKVVQGLKNGDKLYLVAAQRNTSPSRVVLKNRFSSKPILLNVVYTRYKK